MMRVRLKADGRIVEIGSDGSERPIGGSANGLDARPRAEGVKAALADAQQSLRNIKAVDVVSTGLRGENLTEWRALVRISFLVERVSE